MALTKVLELNISGFPSRVCVEVPEEADDFEAKLVTGEMIKIDVMNAEGVPVKTTSIFLRFNHVDSSEFESRE